MTVADERTGPAALVTIDRPERRNAVEGATAAALRGACERLCADDEARLMVLTGAGDAAFCAGADRRAVLEGVALPLADGLAAEAALGREQVGAALAGAQRFAQRRRNS